MPRLRPAPPVPALLALAVLALPALAGCQVGDDSPPPPQFGGTAGEDGATVRGPLSELGPLAVATSNTTRVGGADAATNAAAVASAAFPSTSGSTRPLAVSLVDRRDWPGMVAAAVLSAPPIGAPVLLSDGDEIPRPTAEALERLDPAGADLAQGAQVIRIGDRVPGPAGRRTTTVGGADPYSLAAGVDRLSTGAQGDPSDAVVVASGERAAFAMPAAAWAARSGDSVLFTRRDRLPAPTIQALREHDRPDIFVLGPETVISKAVERELGRLGRVRRIAGPSPVENAIAFARYRRSGFGWGISIPGYQFTVANLATPADVAAAAALGSNGIFAPLLLTDRADRLPGPLEGYFLDVRPGFEDDPRTAVFNHVWIIGDASAVSAGVQGRLDEISELIPVQLPRRREDDERDVPGVEEEDRPRPERRRDREPERRPASPERRRQ